jgi:hypothetical protein
MHLGDKPTAIAFFQNSRPAAAQPFPFSAFVFADIVQEARIPSHISRPGQVNSKVFYIRAGRFQLLIHKNLVYGFLKSIPKKDESWAQDPTSLSLFFSGNGHLIQSSMVFWIAAFSISICDDINVSLVYG